MTKTIRTNIAGHRFSIAIKNRCASVTLTRRAARECGHFRSDFGDCTTNERDAYQRIVRELTAWAREAGIKSIGVTAFGGTYLGSYETA